MRSRVVTALVVTAAGLTVSAALRRFRGRRASLPAAAVPAAPVAPVADRDAVILAFPRPAAAPAPAQPAAPARCGDNGGRTKAGAPCAARATAGGRCHHHRLAA
jgi:predicted lipid-binding transport protein (Tim44 family)